MPYPCRSSRYGLASHTCCHRVAACRDFPPLPDCPAGRAPYCGTPERGQTTPPHTGNPRNGHERSPLNLEFTGAELQGRKLQGPCIKLGEHSLFVDVGGAYASPVWAREPVQVFFKTTAKRKASYYQFSSYVIDAQIRRNTFVLQLPVPATLEPGQKRSFVRVEPQKGAVLGLGLWPMSDRLPLPTSIHTMKQATFNFRPGKSEDVRVVNLSAGGMRLSMDKELKPFDTLDLSTGSQVLCLLVLRSNEGEMPLPFWLACTIVSFSENQEKNSPLFLGLRFTNWALMENGRTDIVWFPIHKDRGVAPLASWVMRHHLEQSKHL